MQKTNFFIHNISFSHTSRHLHPAAGGGHNIAAHSSYTTVCNDTVLSVGLAFAHVLG
jgi:hypothetical protein